MAVHIGAHKLYMSNVKTRNSRCNGTVFHELVWSLDVAVAHRHYSLFLLSLVSYIPIIWGPILESSRTVFVYEYSHFFYYFDKTVFLNAVRTRAGSILLPDSTTNGSCGVS